MRIMRLKIGKIELDDWQSYGDSHWIRCDLNAELRKPIQINPDWDRCRVHLAPTFSRFDSAFAGSYIWFPFFDSSISSIRDLYGAFFFREFPISEVEEAKAYIDRFLVRVSKLTAFLNTVFPNTHTQPILSTSGAFGKLD